MMKKNIILVSLVLLFISICCSIQALQLREPVGRIGKNLKSETYVKPTASFDVLNPKKQPKEEKTFLWSKKKSNKQNGEEKEIEASKTNNDEKISLFNSQSKSNFLKDAETESIVKEIAEELTNDREVMLSDLKLLWVAAVENSETIRFAIMKLSNPNGEEVNKSGFKKIITPIIKAAPLLGQGLASPAAAAGSLIGSGVLGSLLNDNSEMKAALTKVNDADLVILAKAIDDLQQNLVINYMGYIGAYKEYEYAIKITTERQKKYEELNQTNSPDLLLANTFYTEALDNQYKARQEFLMKRVVLEQMVGNAALLELEKRLKPEDS